MLDITVDHLLEFCKTFKKTGDPVRVDHRDLKSSRPSLPKLDLPVSCVALYFLERLRLGGRPVTLGTTQL